MAEKYKAVPDEKAEAASRVWLSLDEPTKTARIRRADVDPIDALTGTGKALLENVRAEAVNMGARTLIADSVILNCLGDAKDIAAVFGNNPNSGRQSAIYAEERTDTYEQSFSLEDLYPQAA